MTRLRGQPPDQVGGRAVTGVDDLNRPAGDLPPTDGVRWWLDGGRVVVRPSGTEPKIKAYVEMVVPVDSDLEAARGEARKRLDGAREDVRVLLG